MKLQRTRGSGLQLEYPSIWYLYSLVCRSLVLKVQVDLLSINQCPGRREIKNATTAAAAGLFLQQLELLPNVLREHAYYLCHIPHPPPPCIIKLHWAGG